MIEIAPKEYHIKCSYEDAMLYCFALNIDGKTGWRIPEKIDLTNNELSWILNDEYQNMLPLFSLIPVRDI